MSDRWYIGEEDGGREPVMLDPDGCVIKPVGPSYAAGNGKRYRREVRREPPVVAAAPGWYAAFSWWHLVDESASDESEVDYRIERIPIIAWEAEDFGDAYLVSDIDDGPVQRLRELSRSDLAPLGIFHEQYRPEWATIDEVAQREAQDAAKEERARMRRWEAAQVNGSGPERTMG